MMPSKIISINQLSVAVQVVPPRDQLIVLGDMNAESGTDDRSGNGVVGPFGFGAANDNNERLLSFCGSHNLTILGSWFCRLNIHRWSWLSRDITRKEIDHIITRSTDRLLFKNYRVLRSADSPVNSEHLLVMVKAENTC